VGSFIAGHLQAVSQRCDILPPGHLSPGTGINEGFSAILLTLSWLFLLPLPHHHFFHPCQAYFCVKSQCISPARRGDRPQGRVLLLVGQPSGDRAGKPPVSCGSKACGAGRLHRSQGAGSVPCLHGVTAGLSPASTG